MTPATQPTAPAPSRPAADPVDLADLAHRLDERIETNRPTTHGLAPITAPKGAPVNETKTFVHVDLETLLRGRVEHGSICEIDGIGPVDLTWVHQTLGDSFVVMLLKNGPRIIDLVHTGRDATALQRSYKQAQGIHCERPGCSSTKGLELHHVTAWSPSRVTTVRDLAWLCAHDHDLVTHHGHTLTGPPDQRTWSTPHGTTTTSSTTDTRAGPPPDATTDDRTAEAPDPGSQFSLFA